MSVYKPFVGPVIGYLSHECINVWLGDDTNNPPSKSYAVLIIQPHNPILVNPQIDPAVHAANIPRIYTKQLKVYDCMTGVIHVDSLQPATEYDIWTAITTSLEGVSVDMITDTQYTDNMVQFTVRTQPDPTFFGKTTIALASCQYPEPRGKSDKIWQLVTDILDARLQGNTLNNTPIMCHVGDQIYADQLNRHIPLRRTETIQQFTDLYTQKYKGKYFSRFAQRYPSVMIMDDHEIEDNWCMDRIDNTTRTHLADRLDGLAGKLSGANPRDLFCAAIQSYKTYQAAHSPLCEAVDTSRLWYTFSIGVYPFFVIDARTERYADEGHLLGLPNAVHPEEQQLKQLCIWLAAQPADVPKFILSSVIFAPFTASDLANPSVSDNWTGYPKTRSELLQFIVDNRIQKVVFLSGDVHNSMASTITLRCDAKNVVNAKKVSARRNRDVAGTVVDPTAEDIRMYHIVSSPLFWPYPFADGKLTDYVLNSDDPAAIKKSKWWERILQGLKLKENPASPIFKFKDVSGRPWSMHYETHLNSYTQLNNFAVLDFDKTELDVKWYGMDAANDHVLAHHTIFF